MTTKILATSVLALVFAGCAQPGSGSGTDSSASRTPTSGAARVAGDLVPTRLVSVSIPKPTEEATVSGSAALPPKRGITIEQAPMAVTAHDVHRVMKGDPASFTLMVDHPDGARVLVHSLDPSRSISTVHIVDVATGNRLDAARDATAQVNVNHIAVTGATPPRPITDARNEPLYHPTGPVAREVRDNPFVSGVDRIRRLSFDRPYAGGMVRVEVPAEDAAAGIVVELQQPNSHITETVVADQNNHTFGETAEFTVTLLNDAKPITDAHIEGVVELPGHDKLPPMTFSSHGNGQWVGRVPLSSAETKYMGVWNVRIRASGTDDGVGFERDAETAIGYYPSHAQITGIGAPLITRGADHLVDSISIDADVETLVDDRFALRAVLTYTAPDGVEHPLAEAQTGQLVHAGKGTMTLTFDNASLALAGVDGPFHLRDVALVSQGWGHTQYRLGRALDIQTGHLRASEIRYPSHIPMQAQDMMANGDILPKGAQK